MAHFLCHLGCSHFGALLLDFYFTENSRRYSYIYFTCILQIINSGYMENQMHQMYNKNMEWIAYAFCPI